METQLETDKLLSIKLTFNQIFQFDLREKEKQILY